MDPYFGVALDLQGALAEMRVQDTQLQLPDRQLPPLGQLLSNTVHCCTEYIYICVCVRVYQQYVLVSATHIKISFLALFCAL